MFSIFVPVEGQNLAVVGFQADTGRRGRALCPCLSNINDRDGSVSSASCECARFARMPTRLVSNAVVCLYGNKGACREDVPHDQKGIPGSRRQKVPFKGVPVDARCLLLMSPQLDCRTLPLPPSHRTAEVPQSDHPGSSRRGQHCLICLRPGTVKDRLLCFKGLHHLCHPGAGCRKLQDILPAVPSHPKVLGRPTRQHIAPKGAEAHGLHTIQRSEQGDGHRDA
mmetsp:Transcript_42954/g.84703  ORF Transcript_42954/g.84703 Transcript_42954/m.84703 type:complete len:224 (-) Transcript_42954:283-954(-)